MSAFLWVCLGEDEAVLPQWGFLRDVQVPTTLVVSYVIEGLKN